MIIFFENGRLGNQLFQYCALRKFSPNALIIAVGMRELRMNFTGIDLLESTVWHDLLESALRLIGSSIYELLAIRLRLMTFVIEERTSSTVTFKITNGLLKRLVYFQAGFYQSPDMVDESIASSIELNRNIRDRADEFLGKYAAEKNDRYFVHVRRGDYTHWPSQEAPAVMPLRWYVEQMERIRRMNPKAQFFILSDDKPYVEEFFSSGRDTVIVRRDAVGDFAIMTQCGGGGVLSASSYAWWASYFVRRSNRQAYFVAPLFWAGYRNTTWFPEGICTDWIQYAS